MRWTLPLFLIACASDPLAVPPCEAEWSVQAEHEYATAVGLTEPKEVPCKPWELLCRWGWTQKDLAGGGVATRRKALAAQVEALDLYCRSTNQALGLD